MATVPAKTAERITSAMKRFQPILSSAKARDVNESDTVTIVLDILAEMLGYDKYTEITKEYAIRGTYCDLAIELEGHPQLLIEVKAIGLDLKDQHVKQAVDYAANKGVEWVILTNGTTWRIYRVIFAKPIDQDLVFEINLLDLNPKSAANVEQMFLLSREGWVKSTLPAYYNQRQATNKFSLAAVLLTDSVIDSIRKELRKLSPDVKVQNEEVRDVLIREVLKREVTEGEKAVEARSKVLKIEKANARQRAKAEKPAPQPKQESKPIVAPEPNPMVEAVATQLSDTLPPKEEKGHETKEEILHTEN
jgi:predicted type IV restriction endonuclease